MRHSLFSIITLLTLSFMLTACSEAQRTDFEEEFETCDDGQSILEGQQCPEPVSTTTNPDGTTTNPDGTINRKDGGREDTLKGTITYPDGRVTDLDGNDIFMSSYNVAFSLVNQPIAVKATPQEESIPQYSSNGNDVAYDSLTAIIDANVVTSNPLTLQGLAVRKIVDTDYMRETTTSIWHESENVLNKDGLQIDKKITLSRITATALTLEFLGSPTIEKATLHLESDYTIDYTELTNEEKNATLSKDKISGTDSGTVADSTNDDVTLTVDRNSVFGLTDSENNNIASNYMAYVSWSSHEEAEFNPGEESGTTDTGRDITGAMIVGFETKTIPTNGEMVSFKGKGRGNYSSVEKTIGENASYESVSTGYHTVFDIIATVDFVESTIAIGSENTMKCSDNSNDFATCTSELVTDTLVFTTGATPISYTSNIISSAITAGTLEGTLDARFYGGEAWELGGVFSLTESNEGNALYYFGAFGAERGNIAAPLFFAPLKVDDVVVEEMVSDAVKMKIADKIADNDSSHKSLTEVVTGSADEDVFTMKGLAVVKDNTTDYTRAPNRDWQNDADTAQNISLARLTGAAASLTFDGSGNISGVTVYLKDNQYTASIGTPASGIKIDKAAISLRNGEILNDEDFKASTATISVDRSMGLFGFDSKYMAHVGWEIVKTTDELDGVGDSDDKRLVLEDDIHNISGAMLTGFERADVKNLAIDGVTFTGKGKGSYKNATESYDTIFVMKATVNFAEGKYNDLQR